MDDVTATPPDAAMHTTGTDHVTLVGSNAEDTIAFYRDVLGMSLVLRQPNLDRPDVEHLFFDSGDGRLVTFFVHEDRDSHEGPQDPGVGAVHHLAFRVDPARFESVTEALSAAGHEFSVFDRGAFHSLYTSDHNGLTIELATDVFAIPDDRRAEVLATAHRLRVEDGAEFVEEEHVAAALEKLGLPVERTHRTDADAGRGYEG